MATYLSKWNFENSSFKVQILQFGIIRCIYQATNNHNNDDNDDNNNDNDDDTNDNDVSFP